MVWYSSSNFCISLLLNCSAYIDLPVLDKNYGHLWIVAMFGMYSLVPSFFLQNVYLELAADDLYFT